MARKGSRKQIAQERRDAWRTAVAEGRVVCWSDGGRSYPTAVQAQVALELMERMGIKAWIAKEEK